MTTPATPKPKPCVLCVDDNSAVAEALRIKLSRSGEFGWAGSLPAADELVQACEREQPRLVILDIDMPGRDPLEALAELGERCAEVRVVVFSGHVRPELISRAIEAGAWGYVSKNDGEEALIEALRKIDSGNIAFSTEAKHFYER